MRKIDLVSQPSIETLLLHALNNVGKTHIIGSMLEHEQQYGKCLYACMAGEPNGTLAAYDLGEVELVEFETVDELTKFTKDNAVGWHAVGLDSLQRLGELAGNKVTGGAYIVGAKEDHGRDWAKLKFETFKALMLLVQKCDLLVAVCPSRQHENQITKAVRVVPDVSGISETIIGRFNFGGYLEATPLGPGNVSRTVSFHTRLDAVTRWNAPNEIRKPVTIPSGTDCWQAIRTAIINGLTVTN